MKTMNLSIQGIGAGAAITRLSEIAMDEYNLEELGYRFQPGSQGEWIAAHDAALAQRQRFIFPTWTPQYLNNGGRLRRSTILCTCWAVRIAVRWWRRTRG